MFSALVCEDGLEYSELFGRFLTERFNWTRAGSGVQALQLLQERTFDVLFLDMRFDRCPPAELLGDMQSVAERFNGDLEQARQFVEDNQGTYILSALRQKKFMIPVLLSYDFSGEPQRWQRLKKRFSPLEHLPDSSGAKAIEDLLTELATHA